MTAVITDYSARGNTVQLEARAPDGHLVLVEFAAKAFAAMYTAEKGKLAGRRIRVMEAGRRVRFLT